MLIIANLFSTDCATKTNTNQNESEPGKLCDSNPPIRQDGASERMYISKIWIQFIVLLSYDSKSSTLQTVCEF